MLKRFSDGFKRAFTLTTGEGAIDKEDILLLERIAAQVAKRKMTDPVILLVESCGPMNFIGSQFIHFLRPILDIACNTKEIKRLATILEKRNSLPLFAKILERMRDEGAK
ncbi:MAG: hypothetical protein AAB244_02425, partial [Nitrospirota bacterium]